MAFYKRYKGNDFPVDVNQQSENFIDMSGAGRNTSTTQNNATTRVGTNCYDKNGNQIYAEIASAYTQTVSVVNGSYVSSWSVSRTSSPEEGAATGTVVSGTTSGGSATVYLKDELTSAATAKSSSTDFTSLQKPTISTNTDTSVKVTNPNAYACTLYWGTTSGATTYSTSIAANASNVTVSSNISAGTTYYFTLKANNTTTNYGVSKSWNSLTVSGTNTLTITGSTSTSNATISSPSSDAFTTPVKITVSKGTGVNTATFTYTNNSGSTATATSTFYAKKGTSFSWTATPSNYYFLTSAQSSGSGTADSSKTVSLTATAGYYKVVGQSTNGWVQVSADNSSWYDSVVAQYGNTIYFKVRGNSYYYYEDSTSLNTKLLSKANNGVNGTGAVFTERVTTSYCSFTSTTPATSASAANDNYKATSTFAACVAYSKINLLRQTSNSNITGTIIASNARGGGSTSVTVTWDSNNVSTNIYEYDTVRLVAAVSSYGSYKLVSSNFQYSIDRNSSNLEEWTGYASNTTTTYQTTNSARTGWTNTSSSGSATTLVYSYIGEWQWSSLLTPNPWIKCTATDTTWTYHGFSDKATSEIGKNSSASVSPFTSTGVSKLNYYPTTSIKVYGSLYMSGDSSNFDQTILGGFNITRNIKHAALTRSHTLKNNSSSTTAPSSISMYLSTGSGGGAYKSKAQFWGVGIQE